MKKIVRLSLLTVFLFLMYAYQVLAQTPELTQTVTCHDITVRRGDTLTKIAQQYYNDPLAYEPIIEATNTKAVRDTSYGAITSPRQLDLGQKLCLPDVPKIKIAVVYYQAGPMSGYTDSLTKGINVASEEIEESRDFLPLELITAQMSTNQEENQQILNQLLKQEPIAIIAPYFSLSLITSPTIPLEHQLFNAQLYTTSALGEIGSDEHQTNLSSNQHSVLNQTLKKLKFEGKLQDPILIYDPRDSFSQWGSKVISDALNHQQVRAIKSQEFKTGKEDFKEKLNPLRFSTPNATFFISASQDEIKRLITLNLLSEVGYHNISLKNQFIALTEETHPAIFDLGDLRDNNQDKTSLGIAWHVTTTLTDSHDFPVELQNFPFATQTYLALWMLVMSVDDNNPTDPQMLRPRLNDINESHLIQLHHKGYFYFDQTKKLRKSSQKLVPRNEGLEHRTLQQWRYRRKIKAQ